MKRFPALPAVILLTRGILSAQALVNPLLPSGADPWVTQRGGFYYYMNTTGSSLTIWKTRNMADLATAEKKVVWRPPATGPYTRDIWAPELHFLRGKWYIYFAADASGAFGPGHGSFFRSPDGTEDWMLYHANAEAGQGCGNRRAPRAQPFTWKADGTPDFGRPVGVGVPVTRPSGE
jgi:GH43 family beta-xylosidase